MNSEVFVKLTKFKRSIMAFSDQYTTRCGRERSMRKSVLVSALITGLLTGSFTGSAMALSFDDGVEAYLAGRYESALEIWAPLAAEGDAVAMFNIGVLHAQGLGVKQDPVVAVDWYRQAADRGYAPAQFNLGASYHNGQGVERDDELAASWWQLAADQGEVQAQYHLAVLYLEGRGVALDQTTARYFLEQAARQGDSRAAETLNTLIDQANQETRTVSVSDQDPESVTGIVADSAEAAIEETIDESSTQPTSELTTQSSDNGGELVAANGSTELVTPVVLEEADTASTESEPVVVTAENSSENSSKVIYTTESAEMQANSAWVNERNPDSYTIQLLATKERSAAEKFITDQNLEGRAQVFFAGAGNSPLYKVIYGNYASAADANKERKTFPDALMKNTPWIRDFGSIQAEAVAMSDSSAAIESSAELITVEDSQTQSADTTVSEVVSEVVENETVAETAETAAVETVAEDIWCPGERAFERACGPRQRCNADDGRFCRHCRIR